MYNVTCGKKKFNVKQQTLNYSNSHFSIRIFSVLNKYCSYCAQIYSVVRFQHNRMFCVHIKAYITVMLRVLCTLYVFACDWNGFVLEQSYICSIQSQSTQQFIQSECTDKNSRPFGITQFATYMNTTQRKLCIFRYKRSIDMNSDTYAMANEDSCAFSLCFGLVC